MISDPWTQAPGDRPETGHPPRRRADRRTVASWHVAAIIGLTIAVLGIDHGGTGRGAWGWAALPLAAAAGTLAVSGVRVSRPAAAWIAALAALTGWTALSALWSASPSVALEEADRTVVYLGVGILLVAAAPRTHRWVPHAIALASTAICVDGLLLRIFPGFPGNSPLLGLGRLYQPVGYWNALGMVAAMGGLIALQIAHADSQPRSWRIAASVSLAITLPVMYLTFSRGSVIAFGVGLLVSLAATRNRVDWSVCTLANAVAPAVVIAIAAHQQGLVSGYGDLAEAGDVLGVAVLLGMAMAVPIGLAVDVRPCRLRAARLSRRSATVAVLAVAAAAAVGLVAEVGSPAGVWHRADAAFNREIWFKRDLGGNLNNRYGELSLSGRTRLWEAAWQLGREHPLYGAGAGGFGPYWESLDRYPHGSSEALSLYLETFAELGVVGFALVGGLVLLPFAAAVRGIRGEAGLVLGAFAAFVLHAAQDMDWEWPVVAVIGIACAALIVRQVRPTRPRLPLPPTARLAGAAVALTLAVIALGAAVAAAGLV